MTEMLCQGTTYFLLLFFEVYLILGNGSNTAIEIRITKASTPTAIVVTGIAKVTAYGNLHHSPQSKCL